MNDLDIHTLCRTGIFEDQPLDGTLEETHISWVILNKKRAFKVKKPVKLSFLDFSTLSKRKKYCETELRLNQRFSDIYLAVLPIRHPKDVWLIGEGTGKIVDYAVVMRRMMPSKRMDKLLKNGKVSKASTLALAKQVADFHSHAKVISSHFDPDEARGTFNDIKNISTFVKENLGEDFENIISLAIQWSDHFLSTNKSLFEQRIRQGFKRDLHGDLHSGNIFLYKKPVIFDCIEFNNDFRQIDTASEIAFLCMDLEAFGHAELSDIFKAEYLDHFPCIRTAADQELFIYYKCMRANIRAKVHAISAGQSSDGEIRDLHLAAVREYLGLVKSYVGLG
ncbi:hypothetical protein [Dyadobacter frigoris]|uniref:Aminoglycoside phosphotransferase domain-containing protein n=1 Tax=Dyadobacter frigoris TaxID=2576211 RepID=A0A4U6CUY6_9BACT|nr:hypothetical protein [Dyadobacter frigoris]TKT85084.1 hypothetical protein FDK13_34505 [Dyadobacter frigoris]